MKFKVGDRVRLKPDTGGWWKFSGTGTVIEVTDKGYTVQPDDETARPIPDIAEQELELIDT